MSDNPQIQSMGWLRDYPDIRDYGMEYDELKPELDRLGQKTVKMMLAEVGVVDAKSPQLEPTADLRPWCSPIEHQLYLGSCTAQAGVGMMEYYERRAFNKHLDASRLFLYKATRNLLKLTGDTGAYLRSTMAAMRLFGVPPEVYWPYTDDPNEFDKEPPAFCYAFAQNYQAIQYFRLDDSPSITTDVLLQRIKLLLFFGLPTMFGFTVFTSYQQAQTNGGKLPYPCLNEDVVSGHAVMAVGYDDDLEIENANCPNDATTGALLIRNSWGTNWGQAGYGWLPYKYVLAGLAVDWWSLLKNEWVDTGMFAP